MSIESHITISLRARLYLPVKISWPLSSCRCGRLRCLGCHRRRLILKRACRAALATSFVEEAAHAFALALPLGLFLCLCANHSLHLLCFLSNLDHRLPCPCRVRDACITLSPISNLEAQKDFFSATAAKRTPCCM